MFDESERVPEQATKRARRWLSPLVWPTLGLLAWLAFELTAQPAIAGIVLCSKFGWKDVKTAIWLRDRDPWRERGQTCFWFLLGWAAVKVMLTGGSLVLLSAAVAYTVQRQMAVPNAQLNFPRIFLGGAIAMMAGIPLLLLVNLIGCASARWSGVRVWIDFNVLNSRRRGVWPPTDGSGKNLADLACRLGHALAFWLLAPGCYAALSHNDRIMAAVFAVPVLMGLATFCLTFSRRVFAMSADEAWVS